MYGSCKGTNLTQYKKEFSSDWSRLNFFFLAEGHSPPQKWQGWMAIVRNARIVHAKQGLDLCLLLGKENSEAKHQ